MTHTEQINKKLWVREEWVNTLSLVFDWSFCGKGKAWSDMKLCGVILHFLSQWLEERVCDRTIIALMHR